MTWWNFEVYSTYLMQRKTAARTMVAPKYASSRRAFPRLIASTPRTTINELVMRTTVFTAPRTRSSFACSTRNISGYFIRKMAYAVKSAPNRSTSVARKVQTPSLAASKATAGSACSPEGPLIATSGLRRSVAVRPLGHHRDLVEILRLGRGRGPPLQAQRAPGVRGGRSPFPEPLEEVPEHHEDPEGEHRGADRGYQVLDLELREVLRVAARHPADPDDEHREEGDVEADEDQRPCEAGDLLVQHLPRHLREPVVEPREEPHHRAAHHRVVEVGHDEVGVVKLHVGGQGPEKRPGEPADDEQEDEGQGVEHRRLEGDRPLVERGDPVEHLHRRGDGDEEGEKREDRVRQRGHPRGEHVVPPHEEPPEGDRQRRVGDGVVPEDRLAGKDRDHLGDLSLYTSDAADDLLCVDLGGRRIIKKK